MKKILLYFIFLFLIAGTQKPFAQKDSNTVIALQNKLEAFIQHNQLDSIQLYETKCLDISTEIKYKPGIAHALSSLGLINKMRGDYPKALENLFKALSLYETLKNKTGVLIQYLNIGTVYDTQGDQTKALEYYLKASKIAEELNDKKYISSTYRNIANVYTVQKMFSKAETYHLKALEIDKSLNNKEGTATSLSNLGAFYSETNSNKAIIYYLEALNLFKEIENKQGIANCLLNISAVYTDLNQNHTAESFLLQVLTMENQLEDKGLIIDIEKIASQIYTESANYKQAFIHYKKYIDLRDSIYSEENTKQSVKAEMNYEFEKKQALAKAENDKVISLHKQQQFFLLVCIVLALVLLFFAGRAYNNKKKILGSFIERK